MSTEATPQQQVHALFNGRKLLLPDLYGTLPGWRFDLSKDCGPSVHDAVGSWMLSWTENEATHAIVKGGSYGHLAKCLYPDAEEAIAVMGCYIAWLFEWDDAFDVGPLTADSKESKLLQDETKRHLAYLLADPPGPKPAAVRPINAGFSEIAARIVAKCSTELRKHFLHDMEEYVDSVTDWQGRRQDGSMPTVAEHYASRRLGAAVIPCTTLIGYCYGLDIPSRIMEHEALQEILERTTEIAMIANDMVSLAAELATGQLNNIVCVLAYHQSMSAQEAMDHTATLIRNAHAAFEAAERRLPLPTGDPTVDEGVRTLVLGCKDLCTGNISWSCQCARYFGDNPVRENGRLVIQL